MKEKYFHMYGKAVDADGAEHIVTVVGKFEQKRVTTKKVEPSTILMDGENKKHDGFVFYDTSSKIRSLKLGYAICHPTDEFDEEVGVKIAKGRINRGDFIGELETHNITMLNDDQCNLTVFGELQYIINNIDKYLPQDEETMNITDIVDELIEEEMFDDEMPSHIEEVPDEMYDATEEPIDNANYAPNFDNLPNLR